MLRSMTTLGGALCFFASAVILHGQAAAAGKPEITNRFIAGDFSNSGSDDTKKTASSAKKKTGKVQKASAASKRKTSPSPKSKKNYAKLVKTVAKKHGVPTKIAMAVVQVESNFNPRARGSAGEVGLMQIKPATARGMGYRGSTKALYDPKTNLEWGMKYLAGAHQRASGDVCGTILRYNAGHYAKRMNPISRRYCNKVKRILSTT